MNQLNDGHYVEAIDRTNIIAEMMDSLLLEHWVFIDPKHAAWKEKVEKAQSIIASLYQDIGTYMHENIDK